MRVDCVFDIASGVEVFGYHQLDIWSDWAVFMDNDKAITTGNNFLDRAS